MSNGLLENERRFTFDPSKNGLTLDELASRFLRVRHTRDGFTAQCPSHDDRHNSLSIKKAADGRILVKCHAGCETQDVLKSVGLTFRDLFPFKRGQAAFSSSKIRRNVRLVTNPSPAGDPVVSQSSASPQGVFPVSASSSVDSLGISPSSDSPHSMSSIAAVYSYVDADGHPLYEVVRMEPKGFYQRRPNGDGTYSMGLGDVRRVLYRLDKVIEAVRSGRTILLCEGEKDADVLNALHPEICATTAPMGAGKWREEYTAALAGGHIVICPDNDDAGAKHLQTAGTALLAAGCDVRVARVTALDLSLNGKKGADVSDYLALAQDPHEAVKRLLREAVPFSGAAFDGIDAYLLDGFQKEIVKAAGTPVVSTGFPSLDKQLGRLYAGLYVLGSVSSLGKTAFVGQMALSIAAQGRKVLFFSLEMSRAEMTARCIARLLFERDPIRFGNLGVNDILYGETNYEVNQEIRSLAVHPALKNLSVVEGEFSLSAEEIRAQVLETRKAYGTAPIVIVDYLQIMSSQSGRAGERQSIDENVLALKRLSREADTPVFVVSSFNRQNYTAGASYAAFKESGAIEYSADVVLALQADGVGELASSSANDPSRQIERITNEVKRRDVRALELVTLKNRRGVAHGRIPLHFYAGRYFFLEAVGV